MFDLFVKKNIWWMLITIFFALELVSLASYLWPWLGNIFLLLIVLLTAVLSLQELSLGLLIVFGELIIGSQGHLLDLYLGGGILSLRVALWLVVVAVSFYYLLKSPNYFLKLTEKFRPLTSAYIILLLAVVWGIILGLLNHNNWSNIFFDMNGWLYFLLIWPWLYFKRKYLVYLWTLITAGVSWIFFKTLVVLYIFSHGFDNIISYLYPWLRDFRIAEITYVSGNFWRVFMQNQSMAVVLFLFLVGWLWFKIDKLKEFYRLKKLFWVWFLISLVVILSSYSRSFWLGAVLALLNFFFYLLLSRQLSIKKAFKAGVLFFAGLLVAIGFIQLIINFPFPYVQPKTGNLLTSRLQGATHEAAGGSRLALLGPLFDRIKKQPVLGSGFGTTVTYLSKDPRAVAASPGQTGEYTTYAFEWGYLDIWLKMGLAGLMAYFYLLLALFREGLRSGNKFVPLLLAVSALVFMHITTPYLNHPLGIGVIVLASYLIKFYEP